MKSIFFLFAMLFVVQGAAFSDDGATPSSDFSEWETEFRSSLDTLGRSQGTVAPLSPREPETTSPMITDADALAARDLSVGGDARVERLENRVSQLERSLKSLEERQRNIDRSISDLRRRR